MKMEGSEEPTYDEAPAGTVPAQNPSTIPPAAAPPPEDEPEAQPAEDEPEAQPAEAPAQEGEEKPSKRD
jgi:hypothetical protein